MLQNVPQLGEHAYADGGLEGIAGRLGIDAGKLARQLDADRNARTTRMAGGHAGRSSAEYDRMQRMGVVYRP